ncbi:MAG TPA: cupin domain-containing protein [Alphaproteobacteria bacterium]
MADGVRRVVTGHDKDGNAIIVMDGAAPNVRVRKESGVVSTVMWREFATPAVLDDRGGVKDLSLGEVALSAPVNGSVFRIVEFAPEPEGVSAADAERLAREIGAAPQAGRTLRHPSIHRTDSIDYVVILDGEMDMLVDEGEVHVKAGEVIIQRGTNHAWVNRSGKPCRIAIVLIDAKVRQ